MGIRDFALRNVDMSCVIAATLFAVGCIDQGLSAVADPPSNPPAGVGVVPDPDPFPLIEVAPPVDVVFDPPAPPDLPPACSRRTRRPEALDARACPPVSRGPARGRLRGEFARFNLWNDLQPVISPPMDPGAAPGEPSVFVTSVDVGGSWRTVAYDLGSGSKILDYPSSMDVNLWFRDEAGMVWLTSYRRRFDALALDGRRRSPLFEETRIPNTADLAGLRIADLDGDRVAEFVYGSEVFAIDGTRRWLGASGDAGASPAVVDVDGDGRREVITGAAIYDADGAVRCVVDPTAIEGEPDGAAYLLDLDGDNVPEVLVSPKRGSSWSREWLRVQTLDCGVRRNLHISDIHPDADTITFVEAIGPILVPDRPSIFVSVRPLHGGRERSVLLDHELRPVLMSPVAVERLVDLDGDGLFEVLGSPHFLYADDPFVAVGRIDKLSLFNPRSRDVTEVLPHAFLGDSYVADIEGDGHAELVTTEYLGSDTWSLRVYESEGEPWAATSRFYTWLNTPYTHTPDGEFWTGPVSWRHQGMFNASPSADWWVGRGSDLVVRIAEVCDIECDAGFVTAWVQVGNQGHTDVLRPLVVRLYGERGEESVLLDERRIAGAVSGEWSAGPAIRFPKADYDRLRAVVDGDGWEPEECDRANNEAVVERVCDG